MISALSFFELGRHMQAFLPHVLVNHAVGLRIWQNIPPTIPHDRMEVVPADLREQAKANLATLRDQCLKLRLRASYASLSRMLLVLDDPNGVYRALDEESVYLETALVDELREMTCFSLEGEDERLYRAQTIFGETVADRFPSASVDVEEASRCLALGRATACVFHLMRTMEIGLRVVAKSLNDPRLDPKTNPTWHNILKKGDEELQKPIGQRAPEWAKNDHFFSEAQANLRAVQFAWRNPTMHVEINYDPEKAGDVMQAVKAFMRHLASVLSE